MSKRTVEKKPIKSKEELRREKELNKSIIPVAKPIQKDLGIMAIQKEEDVFVKSNNEFCKIYSIKTSPLPDNNKLPFLELLCEKTTCRMRITSFCKMNADKMNSYSFLTVFFRAGSYAEVYEQIKEFERMLIMEVCKPLDIVLARCRIDNILSFIYMNCTGKMKQFDYNELLSRRTSLKRMPFTELNMGKDGIFECDEKYGKVYFGKGLPIKPITNNSFLKNRDVGFQIAVDIQSMTTEEQELYEYELQRIYNYKLKSTDKKMVSMTYMLSVLADSEEKIKMLDNEAVKDFTDNKMLILPCVGREREAFQSACTFGLLDFKAANMVELKVASSLLP